MSDRKPITKPDLGKLHCSICGTTDYGCMGCHLWHFHQVHAPRTHTKIPNQCNLADKTPEHLETICSRRVWIERAHHAEKLLKSHTKIWLDWFSPDPVDSTVKETLTVGELHRDGFLQVAPFSEKVESETVCTAGDPVVINMHGGDPVHVCSECGKRVSGCMGCHLRDVHGIHSTFSHNLSNECFGEMSEHTRPPAHEDCMFKHPLVSPAYFLRSDQQMGCEGGIIIETSGHWQVVTRLEEGEVAAFGWYDTPWQALDSCYAKSESRNHDPIKLVSIKELAEKEPPNCSEMDDLRGAAMAEELLNKKMMANNDVICGVAPSEPDPPTGFKRLDPDQAECFVAENKRVTELFYAMDQAFRESGCFGVFLDRIETIVMAHAREAENHTQAPDTWQVGVEDRLNRAEIWIKEVVGELERLITEVEKRDVNPIKFRAEGLERQ